MTDDISRETFNHKKHYRKVIAQQGRVIIDSDLNEQSNIQYHYDITTRKDIIGKAGTNFDDNGFRIKIAEDEACQKMIYKISKGKYYVNGILCENEKDVFGNDQPDLRSFHLINNSDQAVALFSGMYIAYLDVWDRHINYIDDPSIRESALGGPDTSTRAKIIWQIKLLKVKEEEEENKEYYQQEQHQEKNEENYDFQWALSILRKQFDKDKGSIAAGLLNLLDGNKHTKVGVYDGPNNTLYRVEIQNGGDTLQNKNNITCKWGQDNAKYIYKIADIDENSNTITVLRNIQDNSHNIQVGDWVEITDDRHVLWRLPGVMVKISDVKSSTSNFIIRYNPNSISFNNKDNYYFSNSKNENIITNQNFKPEFNPIIKKWNYYGKINNTNMLSEFIQEDKEKVAGTLILENGIYIKFSNGFYETGDHWLIPARVFKKDIEWPKTSKNSNKPRYCKPIGYIHNYSPLALIEYGITQNEREICDIEKILEEKEEKEGEIHKLEEFLEKTFDIFKRGKFENYTFENKDNFIINFILKENEVGITNTFNIIYNKHTKKSTILTQNDNDKIYCGFVTRGGRIFQNEIKKIKDLRPLFRSAIDSATNTGIAIMNTESLEDANQFPIYGPFKHFLNVNTPPAILLDQVEHHKKKKEKAEEIANSNNDNNNNNNKDKSNQVQVDFDVKAVCINEKTFCIRLNTTNITRLKEIYKTIKIRWWAIPSIYRGEQEKGIINM